KGVSATADMAALYGGPRWSARGPARSAKTGQGNTVRSAIPCTDPRRLSPETPGNRGCPDPVRSLLLWEGERANGSRSAPRGRAASLKTAACSTALIRPCERGPFLRACGPLAASGQAAAQGDQGVELAARRPRVDRLRGDGHPVLEVARPRAGHERGGGVHQHDIATRPRLAAEHGADDLRVLFAVAAGEVLDRRARHPEVLRPYDVRADGALAHLGHAALAG